MAVRNGDIQGHILEVRVLCGNRLKETNKITRQSPYVKLDYGGKERRTATRKAGSVNPSFQDKFEFVLIKRIQKIKVTAYNERTLSKDVLIGNGKVDLKEVLLNGYDECTCMLYNNTE
ncbi:unnamed protein product [Rhodiola kirilowii]